MEAMNSSSRKQAQRGLLAALLAAALLAAACSDADPAPPPPPATSVVGSSSTLASTSTTTDTTTGTAAATTTEPSREWTLLAGGDVLMDRTESQGIDPFTLIDPPLSSADFALVNVEMAISNRGLPLDKQFVFRAPLSAAARIAAGGIAVANLANNHAKDYGSDALIDTVEWLEAAGVTTVGAGSSLADAHRHRVLTTGSGVRVAFVGASMIVPLTFAAGEATPGIASAHPPHRSRVLDSVRAAAGEADAVIVTVHWGIERDTCPSPEQRSLAGELLAAGADAVIGHHPHVLQPVEFQDGKLVAYSLGNLVWHPRTSQTAETGALQIDFDGGEIVGWTLHPHLIDQNGAPAPSVTGDRLERILDIVAGDCARHDPPPPDYAATTTPPEDSDTTEDPTTTEDPDTTEDPTTSTLPPPTGTAGLAG